MQFLNPDNLMAGAIIMTVGIIIIISIIYIYLYKKKKLYLYTKSIRNNLEVWISHFILEESFADVQMPAKFYRILKKPEARQVAIQELISCKKNFSGTVAQNIVQLYEHLDLRKDSVRKFRNERKWHIKARGIQELYHMDQMDFLIHIYKNTNNTNEFIRMEAQIGVINMTGFSGLRFLEVISYPLTEWQQIKLLEQLRLSKQKEDLSAKIPTWLLSKNDTVVIFALKLADEYQQFTVRDPVIDCLVHPNEKVRTQALKTLVRLADEKTPAVLLGYFSKEGLSNKTMILDALAVMATDDQLDFLLRLLEAPDHIVKLKTAIVIAACCTNGMDILELRAAKEPEPYYRILRHVKTVK